MEETCPFCNPDVKSIAFANDSRFYAIYNHAPIVPGHCLVIPYEHQEHVMYLTDDDYNRLFKFAKAITKFLMKKFGTEEFDWSLQQGLNAGQSVAHIHLHIIPRKKNDLLPAQEWYHKLNEDEFRSLDSLKFLSSVELKKISDKLRVDWNNEIHLQEE